MASELCGGFLLSDRSSCVSRPNAYSRFAPSLHHDGAHVGGAVVPIDWRGSSGYRMDIFSPSDQPVSASAGVFFVVRRS